jgi:hypothetical protein
MKDGKRATDRGKPAGFDRRTGVVSGSGAGAGDNPDDKEEYDSDLHGEAPDPRRESEDSAE